MNLEQILGWLEQDERRTIFPGEIAAWRRLPARDAVLDPFPHALAPALQSELRRRGIEQLFRHQRQAWDAVQAGRDVCVTTPTASGKTLAYNLPVLSRLLAEPKARALYIFPTKALAQDQRAGLQSLIDGLGADFKTYTYDGDTAPNIRRKIRRAGHVVITNPDMLHTGILPHHTKWLELFENLEFVVVDELHQYRGVFGSHVANVLRRLDRVTRFYGSRPRFITCSATIGNPDELAQQLLGRQVELIDESGAPEGEKHFIFYNPPEVNRQLGIRQSSLLASSTIASFLLEQEIPTITFTRTRRNVELLLSYLRKRLETRRSQASVRGYRGGYLPRERRAIEDGLREGELTGVVATNALELGIDIGRLQACIIHGFPGTVASTWQQAGRVGRSSGRSLVIYVASSSAVDQYLVTHPEFFFDRPPEAGRVNPENLYILVNHLKCSAFELPFTRDERYGEQSVDAIMQFLEKERMVRRVDEKYHWMAEGFPAADISLRSAAEQNVVIIDRSQGHQVIGEVDRFSAPLLVHEQAIYLHESRQYQVEELDFEENKAYVSQVNVNYYTEANLAVRVQVLRTFQEGAGQLDQEEGEPSEQEAGRYFGEVLVAAQPTIFKKLRFGSHENIGWGQIHLPEQEMHTSAYWLTFPQAAAAGWDEAQLEAGLQGAANLLSHVAPIRLSSDVRDLHAVAQRRSPFTERPTIFLYDAYPGGIGLSERLFRDHEQLVTAALDLVSACSCAEGCPACVGPADAVGPGGKDAAGRLLRLLVSGQRAVPDRAGAGGAGSQSQAVLPARSETNGSSGAVGHVD